MKNLFKSVGLLLLLITVFTSCSKDDEVVPAYVGTWVNQMVDDSTGLAGTQTLILTANTFDMKISFDFLGQQFTMGEGKGDFSVSGNKVKMTLTQIGIPDTKTGKMTFYGPGTAQYESALEGGSATEDGEYSIVGNKLTLKIDENGDDEYTGDEIQVFTKK